MEGGRWREGGVGVRGANTCLYEPYPAPSFLFCNARSGEVRKRDSLESALNPPSIRPTFSCSVSLGSNLRSSPPHAPSFLFHSHSHITRRSSSSSSLCGACIGPRPFVLSLLSPLSSRFSRFSSLSLSLSSLSLSLPLFCLSRSLSSARFQLDLPVAIPRAIPAFILIGNLARGANTEALREACTPWGSW